MRSAKVKLAKEILDVLDRYDISVVGIYEQGGEYYAEIEFASNLGEDVIEDIWFNGTNIDFIVKFGDHAYNFDPDEHAEPYIEMRGRNGVPNSVRALIRDAEEIGELLDEVSDKLNDLDVDEFEEEEDEDDYDESYRKIRRPSRIKTERFNRKRTRR